MAPDPASTGRLREALAGFDLDAASSDLDDGALRRRAVELQRVIDRLGIALAEALAEMGSRGIPAADGETDPGAWLAARTGASRRAARSIARHGSDLASAPHLAEAAAQGRVSSDAARALLRARNPRTESAWLRDERELVKRAAEEGADRLEASLRRWTLAADPGGPDPATDPGRNQLSLTTADGRGLLRADLDAESTAIVSQALTDVHDELWRAAGDRQRRSRSVANWRAEALVELVRRARRVDPGRTRPARPLLTVVVDLADLSGPQDRLVELPTGVTVAAESVRRMGCDASVARVVMSGTGEPLEAGRARRQPSAAQARAVLARDRGCGIADCNAPPWMCEIHHRRHWADGGTTDVDNLVMICRRHHRLVHEGGFSIRAGPDGRQRLQRDPPRTRAA